MAAAGACSTRWPARLRSTSRSSTSPTSTRSARPWSGSLRWSGSRRLPIRCCASRTSREVATAAKAVGALVVADNTFLSPALQRPIEHGADIVVHSTTKFINGHSDVVGGAVIAADPAVLEQLAWWANALGLVGAPFDSFLTLRGLRTLDARLRVHQENTAQLAEILGQHRAVSRLHYPGLRRSSRPRHRAQAAGRLRRAPLLRACGRRSRGPPFRRRPRAASRSRNPWAASRASSRIPRP